MKSRMYYVTYKNKDGFIAIKPYIATSEKKALQMFKRTHATEPIKISTEII